MREQRRARAGATRSARARAIAPFAALALLAYPLVAIESTPVKPGFVLASLVMTAAVLVTMLALDWSRVPRIAAVATAYGYIIGVVLLREGSGGGQSGFGILFLLPVLWVALYGERWEVGAVVTGVALALLVPILVVGAPTYPTTEWRKLVLTTAVAGVLGWAVKSLVDRLGESLRAQERQTANLGRLAELNRAIGSAPDSESARDAICAAILDVMGADVVTLWEAGPESLLEATATTDPELRGSTVAEGQHHSGVARAYRTREPFFVGDAVRETRLDQDLVRRFAVGSCLFWPVVEESRTVAVLMIGWSGAQRALPDAQRAVAAMLAVEVGEALARIQRQDALATAAATDPLTGLPNRRWWDTLIEHELAEAARSGASVTVAVIDLDFFKAWNDEHGHQAGDELLYQTALAWKRELRAGDVLARIGGDEFVVALPGCSVATATEIVARLTRAIPHDRTASSGLALWDGSEDAAALIARADQALYRAKAEGRDRTSLAA
jgi:diguanylate cyclase (GGDEF)-like protein